MRSQLLLALLLLALLAAAPAAAQAPVAAAPAFDAKEATDRYLAGVPAAEKARSDAYFEGGYWLLLWDFLYGAGMSILLLETRLSARFRTLAERITRLRPLQTFLYWMQYLVAVTLLGFPLTVYEGFFRERAYGLMNQTFLQWLGDQGMEFLVAAVLGGIAMMALFGVARRLPRTWHLWGAVLAAVLLAFSMVVAPLWIAPLFNRYTPLHDQRIKQQILSLARANGIPATEVYEVDASRQSKRISANVSGFLGTERITLNDNLLKRCTPDEILSVMGHEMGHYVMGHVYTGLLYFAVLTAVVFSGLRWALARTLGRWGERWQIRSESDTAVLPLAMLILSTFFFLLTPVSNTFSRTQEYQADLYGLNAARLPDAEARVDLMLREYRKLDPTPVEEFIFYDHPSGRTRIYSAMRWKAENMNTR